MAKDSIRAAMGVLANLDAGLEAEKAFDINQTEQACAELDKQIEGLKGLKKFLADQCADRCKAIDLMIGKEVPNENS